MAPEPWVARLMRPLPPALLALALMAPHAHALRVVSYNILNYPGTTGPTRDPNFRVVLEPLGADLVCTGEMQSQAGVNEFLNSVLNTLEPGQWAATPFIDGNDTDNALFYKPSRFQYLGQWAFYPNPANLLRLVHVYRLKPVGYTSEQAEIRLYALHLKASDGSAERAQRLAEAIGLRDSMNAAPPGTHLITLGDFNFYRGSDESAYWKLLESQLDNDGRVYDPLNPAGAVQNWHDNASFASIHTQSPCLSGGCASGASTGGMDDRFDFIFPTYNWNNGTGLELLANTYVAVGNDGQHLNLAINSAPVIPEGSAYANALMASADHLPLRVDISLPSRMSVSGGPFVLGTVIVGAAATTTVNVSNPAVAPADSLTYSVVSSGAFSTAPGPFNRAAVAGSDALIVSMDTVTPGAKSGGITIHSDAPDTPTFNVFMSGTVLRHAVASVDSANPVVSATLDFGVQDPGGFTDQAVRLHNLGWDALQAQLAVSAVGITGGAGRFTLTGGTAPITLAGVGETYTVQFDDAGATRDSLYEATLTFQSGDAPLPGATALPDLQVTLQAKLTPGSTTGTDAPSLPATTRLYAPAPNPLRGASTLRFDLARAGDVRLEVFDLSGRRVTTLAAGAYGAGRYHVRWDGQDDRGGRAGAGLYFVRLTGAGDVMSTRLAIMK
jgi:hypothetical protein